LNQIDYAFKTKASSVREALEKVGLNQTSEPHKGPLSFYWNESTGPLVCCGFEMDNVVISSDFSGISVGFRRIVAAAPPKPAAAKPRSRSPEKADEFLGARIALAKLLQAIYSKEGRLIDVAVTGEGQYILELSSVLIGKGTYTLEAARRETIDSSSSIAVIRRARFKRIVIRGNNYSETYAVN